MAEQLPVKQPAEGSSPSFPATLAALAQRQRQRAEAKGLNPGCSRFKSERPHQICSALVLERHSVSDGLPEGSRALQSL